MSAGAEQLRIVVIDNYDSFTYNIVHALASAGAHCDVWLHDEADEHALLGTQPQGIVISAGPCGPAESGLSLPLARALLRASRPPPLLGICLGHQCLACGAGARLRRARQPMHGMRAAVHHDGSGILTGLADPLLAARYNSLAVEPDSLPHELIACGFDDDGEPMAIRHRELPLYGVQFHPESALSVECQQLFVNWLEICRARRPADD